MPGIASPAFSKQTTGTGKTLLLPFILVTSLFFFWGFVHNIDPILLAHLRKTFQLNVVRSSFVDFAVFIAYFAMALPAGYIMRKYGYKAGIILGLLLFAGGCFLFLPAASTRSYAFFLGALFIIASGLTFLETAANPYATVLGPPESATQRLNLAQSFNGLATVVAPLIGGKLILSGKNHTDEELAAMGATVREAYFQSEADSVKLPYLILGLIILLVAIIFVFAKMPDTKEENDGVSKSFLHAFRYKHLTGAVIAQFFYVGAQVCVTSFFIVVVTKAARINEKQAAEFLGYGYGIAFMAGRFIGTFVMRYIQPQKLLTLYAIINVLLSIVVIFAEGMIIVYALIGIGFFMSIMFPTIFSLGIHKLGNDTKLGSSLIIMSIVGGAALPFLLGAISDTTGNIQYGYLVPLLCFVVVCWYGWKGYKVKEVGNA